MLESNGHYVLTGPITVPAGKQLTIVAREPGSTQATARPQIVWNDSNGVNRSFDFDCFGDIALKNVWMKIANGALRDSRPMH